MALKNEAVLEQWGEVLEHGAGKGKWILDRVEIKIKEAKMPGVAAQQQSISSGMFGTKRDFLVVAHASLRDYHMYIGARDFGTHLDVAWYLTVEPGFLKRSVSKYTLGNPQALSMQVDFFSQQDLRAFVGVAHHYVTETFKTAQNELGQDPTGLNTKSKGFLELW
jgi:hypothetical protein